MRECPVTQEKDYKAQMPRTWERANGRMPGTSEAVRHEREISNAGREKLDRLFWDSHWL
jgi:hypothetical protein